jgi:hypothetical protein
MDNVFAKESPQVYSCNTRYSFFWDLIAPLWGECSHRGPIHRICSLMRKMRAQTLVIEVLEPNREIQEEYEDIQTRIDSTFLKDPLAYRITFFASSGQNQNWKALPKSSILGYVVLLKLKLPTECNIVKQHYPKGDMAYVLEAVIRPPGLMQRNGRGTYRHRLLASYYIPCIKEFHTIIGTQSDPEKYPLHGSFFSQQNIITHVCSHAALRSAINSSELGIDKISNRKINDFLSINHRTKTIKKGLGQEQVADVMNRLHIRYNRCDFLLHKGVDFAEYIYPHIESGYPVLLDFLQSPQENISHALSVVGHTINSDKWDCEAHLAYRDNIFGDYHASAAWVDHFIVNDDNFGMYSCIPPSYLKYALLLQDKVEHQASFAISILPPSTSIVPYIAEKTVIQLLNNEIYAPQKCKWLEKLFEQLGNKKKGIVARSYFCNKGSYTQHLVEGLPKKYLSKEGLPAQLVNAPSNLFVTEISLPDLYTV